MGPCRVYKRDRNSFQGYEEAEQAVSDKDLDTTVSDEEPPPPPPPPPQPEAKKRRDPVSEEIKGALRYINPKYKEEEIEGILKHAIKSENIVKIIFSCARQYGYGK